MQFVGINHLAILLAAIVAWLGGAAYYTALGKYWVVAQGKTVEQVATEFVREHRSSSIIQRAASTEEVANMVVYVCSPQASATTGAALRVDGCVIDTIA